MSKNQSQLNKSELVTREFLTEQVEKILAKIDYSRKDAGDQIKSIESGLTRQIKGIEEGLSKQMNILESKVEAIHDKLNFVREDVKETKGKLNLLVEKVDKHDQEIAHLKSVGLPA